MPQSHPDRHDLVCQSQHGSVLRCRCCTSIRLRFGNALLGLNEDGFRSLCGTISSTYRGESPRNTLDEMLNVQPVGTDGGAEDVILYLGESGIGFAFSREEIEELHHLLQRARLLLTLPGDRATAIRRVGNSSQRSIQGGRFNARA